MNIHNIFHKARLTSPLHLREGLGVGLCLLLFASCEDYTEKNFGTRDELYQPTQINNLTVDLTDAHYAAVAAEAANIAAAEAAGCGERLQDVAKNKCFNAAISPDEYLLPLLQQLVGKTQYYTMDAGSTITVNCMVSEQTVVDDPAFVPYTGAFKAGKYLLAPIGQEQILGTSGLTADGEHPGYGYLYLTGGDKCAAVTPFGEGAYTIDDTSKGYLYTFDKEGDHFTIRNAAGYYLYLDGSHASFQYTDDLQSDCDDPAYGLWDVTYSTAGFDAVGAGQEHYVITNVGTGQTLLYDTGYKSAGCYSADKVTEKHVGIRLFNEGKVTGLQDAAPEMQTVIFGYDGKEWACKADYINQTLLGQTSTDAETVFALSGWSLEFVGGIGDLTYVWKLDGTYGLRASAYKSSTYYPTDAWCISPAMNMKKAKKPLFQFQEAQKYAGTPLEDYLQVWVSTDYAGRGSLQSAHWTDVTSKLQGTRPDGSSWDYMDMSLDLSEYAGQPDVRVAFRYISTDAVAATWEVKNVVCKEAE